MTTHVKYRFGYGGAVAIALLSVFLVACERDDMEADRSERIVADLGDSADGGQEITRDTPPPATVDSATPEDSFALNEPPWPATDCVASVKPDRVQIQDEPMLITYTFGADFPEPDSVLTDTNSGISVENLDKKLTLVKLNLSRATEGRWMIRFLGAGERACDATLTVRRPI